MQMIVLFWPKGKYYVQFLCSIHCVNLCLLINLNVNLFHLFHLCCLDLFFGLINLLIGRNRMYQIYNLIIKLDIFLSVLFFKSKVNNKDYLFLFKIKYWIHHHIIQLSHHFFYLYLWRVIINNYPYYILQHVIQDLAIKFKVNWNYFSLVLYYKHLFVADPNFFMHNLVIENPF